MIRFLSACLLAGMLPVAMADRDDVVGYWSSGTSIFQIYEESGSLFGQIRALREPNYLPGERPGFDGKPRTDAANPDPALQNEAIVGLHMFSEYQYDDGMWQGMIYDPESGNTYQSRMKVNDRGELEIRGYVGMPMFGRTATFAPAESCSEEIVTMLAQIDGPRPC